MQYVKNKERKFKTRCFAYFSQLQPVWDSHLHYFCFFTCSIPFISFVNSQLQKVQNIFFYLPNRFKATSRVFIESDF